MFSLFGAIVAMYVFAGAVLAAVFTLLVGFDPLIVGSVALFGPAVCYGLFVAFPLLSDDVRPLGARDPGLFNVRNLILFVSPLILVGLAKLAEFRGYTSVSSALFEHWYAVWLAVPVAFLVLRFSADVVGRFDNWWRHYLASRS